MNIVHLPTERVIGQQKRYTSGSSCGGNISFAPLPHTPQSPVPPLRVSPQGPVLACALLSSKVTSRSLAQVAILSIPIHAPTQAVQVDVLLCDVEAATHGTAA
eukprot:26906-Chlamydomonas_euryale.AAC.8